MTITDSLRDAWRVDREWSVVFSLAPTEAKPGPRQPPKDSTKAKGDSAKKKSAPKKDKPKAKDERDTTAFDLTVEVADADGGTARVPLSRYGAVRRPLQSYVYLRKGRDAQRFATTYELVLQTYVIPLADLASQGVNPSRLRTVRWRFDRTPAGTVVLDNIGLSRISPDFLPKAATAVGSGR
jgi:hypothetical protein